MLLRRGQHRAREVGADGAPPAPGEAEGDEARPAPEVEGPAAPARPRARDDRVVERVGVVAAPATVGRGLAAEVERLVGDGQRELGHGWTPYPNGASLHDRPALSHR